MLWSVELPTSKVCLVNLKLGLQTVFCSVHQALHLCVLVLNWAGLCLKIVIIPRLGCKQLALFEYGSRLKFYDELVEAFPKLGKLEVTN